MGRVFREFTGRTCATDLTINSALKAANEAGDVIVRTDLAKAAYCVLIRAGRRFVRSHAGLEKNAGADLFRCNP